MAWSKHNNKKPESERASSEGAAWIHTTSVDEMIEKFRETMKKDGLEGANGDWIVIQLAHVAVMRGQPRKVAPLLVHLLEKREAEGRPAWNLDHSSLGAVGISMVRLMAAYLEDPAIPISKARAAAQLFLRGIEKHPTLKTVGQLMPMIMAVRTDAAPADFSASKRRSGLPLRTDMVSSGVCEATHRQWRVEYLLAMGAVDEALALAHRGRAEKPCGGTCAFAPHSMFAWLLEPLRSRGRNDEATVLEARLAGLLTPRTLYLDAMGCRIHYLALEGRFEDANAILRSMLPFANDPMASPWQRLKFYEGCTRALSVARNHQERESLLAGQEPDQEPMEHQIMSSFNALRQSFNDRIQ